MNKHCTVSSLFLTVLILAPNISLASNSGDFNGAVAIGSSYAGTVSAPANGLVVQGNAGFGTSSPSYPFHVSAANASGPVAYYDQTNDSNKVAIFHKSTNNNQGIIVGNTTDGATNGKGFHAGYFSSGGDFAYLDAYDWGSGVFKNLLFNQGQFTLIGSSGAVGIGTASPRGSAKLDVNGTVYVASFAASSSTTVCQNGNVLSTCSSARKYKSNIEPSPLGLSEVLSMRPVTFDFKNHSDNWEKHDFGFVAEDMEKINPLFVTYDQDGKIEGVRYMQLTAVTAKAIQELHATVETQQRQIDSLQKQVDRLLAKEQKAE